MTPTEAAARSTARRGRPRARDPRGRARGARATWATTGSPWTRSPLGPGPPRPRSTGAGRPRSRWSSTPCCSRRVRPSIPDTGTLRGDLIEVFCGMGGARPARPWPRSSSVLTAIDRDEEFAREFRERVIGPKAAISRTIYERARRPWRGPRGPRRLPLRPGPRRDPAPPRLPHGRGADGRARSLASSTRSSSLPHWHRPRRKPMADLTKTEARAPGQHAHLGWALVLISIAQLMVVLDATIANIALPYIGRTSTSPRRTCPGSSPATPSPSAACCCSAGASVTSTAAAGSSCTA